MDNKYLVGSFLLGIAIQAIVVLIPGLSKIFGVVNLNAIQWIITILISLVPIPVVELQKKFDEKKTKKTFFYSKENNKSERKIRI